MPFSVCFFFFISLYLFMSLPSALFARLHQCKWRDVRCCGKDRSDDLCFGLWFIQGHMAVILTGVVLGIVHYVVEWDMLWLDRVQSRRPNSACRECFPVLSHLKILCFIFAHVVLQLSPHPLPTGVNTVHAVFFCRCMWWVESWFDLLPWFASMTICT